MIAMVESWNCGAKNEVEREYCVSCSSILRKPHKGIPPGLGHRGMVLRLLSGLAKALAQSLILLALAIALTVSVVGLYDFITGHRMLAGIGLTMTAIGCVISFASAMTLNRIPKAIVLAKHPMLSTIFTPYWGRMKSGSTIGEANLSIALLTTGLSMFIIGLFLL